MEEEDAILLSSRFTVQETNHFKVENVNAFAAIASTAIGNSRAIGYSRSIHTDCVAVRRRAAPQCDATTHTAAHPV